MIASLRLTVCSPALLVVLALASACSVDESGKVPCYDDSNCPAAYPQCVGSSSGAAGTCKEAQALPDGGTGGGAANLAIVGVTGHGKDDVVAGPVRFAVTAKASAGVKTLALKAGSATLSPAADSAAPLFFFDVPAQSGSGDLALQAVLTDGAGATYTSGVFTLHYDNQAPSLTLAEAAPLAARQGSLITVDVTSDEQLASVGGDVFLAGTTDTKVGTLSVISGSGTSFKLGYPVPADAPAGIYKVTVTGKDAAGNASAAKSKQTTVYPPFSVSSLALTSAGVEGSATPAGSLNAPINATAKLPAAVPVTAASAVFTLVDAFGHSRNFAAAATLSADASTTTFTIADAIGAGDSDGLAAVKVTITDAAGNVATSAAQLVIDTQVPFVAGFAPDKPLADANSAAVVFKGRASKRINAATYALTGATGSGSCTCDGAACSGSTSSSPLVACSISVPPVNADTTVSLTVAMTDLVGNPSLASSNTSSVGVLQIPVATSLTPLATQITQGASLNLTPTFAGGTGTLINNKDASQIAVTSGALVSVTPSATTTYSLKVKNALGSPAPTTPTSTITVVTQGFGGPMSFDEPIITGARSSAIAVNIPTLQNVTTAALLDNAGKIAKLASGQDVKSSDILGAAGGKLSLQPPSTSLTTDVTQTYTLLALSSGNAQPATTVATLRIVPFPTVSSGSMAITPNTITGGSSTNLSIALPAIGGDTSPTSVVVSLQFASGAGAGVDAINPATNLAWTSAQLLAASGQALAVKFPPTVATDDNKVFTYTLKVKNIATTPDSATSAGAITVYLKPGIDNTQNTLAFVAPFIPGGSSALDGLHVPKLTAGTNGTATLKYFDNAAPGTLINAKCSTGADCTSAQILAASQGTLSITPPVTLTTDSKTYTYQLVLTNGAGDSTSPPVTTTLTVIPRPTITAQPAALTVVQGATATFTVTANSTFGVLSYQWRKGGTPMIDGQIPAGAVASGTGTATLTLTGAQAIDAASYDVVVTNTLTGFSTTTTSNTAALTVNLNLTITAQPQPLTANQGTTATFSVSVTDNNAPNCQGLTYQWKKGGVALVNGGNIRNATTSTLSIDTIGASDTSATYSVSATCTLNTVPNTITSNAVALTVNFTPTISAQPQALTVNENTTATFSVTATDNNAPACQTFAYQWKKGATSLTNAGRISGALTRTLTIANAAASDTTANYSVAITCTLNGVGNTIASSAVALTVNRTPTINTQPQAVTVNQGTTAQFSVSATDNNAPACTLTYAWSKGGTPLANGGNIRNATTSTLSIDTAGAADTTATYSVAVTCTLNGVANTVTSSSAALTVNMTPTITSQPVAITVNQGATAGFSVTAADNNVPACTLTYQWKKGGSAISNGAKFTGVTTAALSIANAASGDMTGTYSVAATCTLNGVANTVTSNAVALTVNMTPTINTQPQAVTVNQGTTAQFSVAATDNNAPACTLTYAWLKGGTALVNGGNIRNATTSTLSIDTVGSGDTSAPYSVAVTCTLNGVANTVTSSTAALTVNLTPTISSQPAALTVNQGATASFSVTATDNNTSACQSFGYQWRKGTTAITNGGRFSGATSQSLSISGAGATDAVANYNVVVTCTLNGVANSVTSSNAALAVNMTPTFSSQPSSLTANQGSPASFTVAVTDHNAGGCDTLTYQWRKGTTSLVNGGNVSGANLATLSLGAAGSGDAATNYNVVVTCTLNSVGNSITSSNATLTVNMTPTFSSQPAALTVNQGSPASFTAAVVDHNAGSCDTLTYQWKKGGVALSNGGNISGATGLTLSLASAGPTDASTTYALTATCTLNSVPNVVTSNNAALTVNQTPTFSLQPASATVAQGTNATLTATAVDHNTPPCDTATYQWKKGTSALTDAGNITGSATASLSLNPLGATDGGGYSVVFTCTLNSVANVVTSNTATITVNQTPAITAQPANATVVQGGSASFTVSATFHDAGTYQWQKAGAPLSDGSGISGSATATLTINPAAPGDAGNYTVVVTNTLNGVHNNVTSDVATLTVTPAPVMSAALTSNPNLLIGGNNGAGFLHFALPAQTSGPAATSIALTVTPTGGSATPVTKTGSVGLVPGDLNTTINVDPPATTISTPPTTYSYSLTATGGGGTSLPNVETVQLLRAQSPLTGGLQRVGATATRLPNGTVLIAGGGNKSVSGVCSLVTGKSATVEIYDPTTGVSATLGGTTPATNQLMSTERCQHQAVLVGTKVYLFGGADSGDSTVDRQIDVFDTVAKTFLTTGFPLMQAGRRGHSATLLGSASGTFAGRIVLAGGFTAGGTVQSSIELFNPGNGTSTPYTTTLGVPRSEHSAVLLDKWLCFMGGRRYTGSSTLAVSSFVDAFDTTKPPTGAGAASVNNTGPASNATERYAHSAAALSNGTDILLVGGIDHTGVYLNSVQTYRIRLTDGSVTAASAAVTMTNGRAYFPMLATSTTDKFAVLGGSLAAGTTDTGTTSVELIDASSATIGLGTYPSQLGVARMMSPAVNLNLSGTSHFAFFVAGGDPGGTAANGTGEVVIDRDR